MTCKMEKVLPIPTSESRLPGILDAVTSSWAYGRFIGKEFYLELDGFDSYQVCSYINFVKLMLVDSPYNTRCELKCEPPCIQDSKLVVHKWGGGGCWACLTAWIACIAELGGKRKLLQKKAFKRLEADFCNIINEFDKYRNRAYIAVKEFFKTFIVPIIKKFYADFSIPTGSMLEVQLEQIFVLNYHLWTYCNKCGHLASYQWKKVR